MKKIVSIILSFTFAIVSCVMPFSASANDCFSDSPVEHCGIHDPSIAKGNDGRYYIVGSHLGMGESDDLVNWHNTEFGMGEGQQNYFGDWKEELAEPLEWCSSYQRRTHELDPTRYNSEDDNPYNDFEYNCWANDIIYSKPMGKYCLYGCCSVWGTTASVIWLATSDSPTGPFEYQKSFIYSGITPNKTNSVDKYGNNLYNGLYYENTNIPADIVSPGYLTKTQVILQPWFNKNYGYAYACGWNEYPNCIDPTAFFDENGEMWLVYGSYSGGCFVIKLDNSTGTPDYSYMNSHKADGYDVYYGKRVSATNEGTEGTGEGPFIIYDSVSDYYYFFLTYGGLAGDGGYNIREYRSKSPDGPYLDANGYDATELKNTGLKLIGNYQFACNKSVYVSPGHSSCLIDDDGSMYQAYHVRFTHNLASKGDEGFQTRVHKMARTEDGWAVILPFEYQNEADTVLTAEDIVGDYEYVDFTNTYNRIGEDSTMGDIISPTQIVSFNADGTITNARKYACDRTHTDLGYKSVDGTWSLAEDGVNATFVIDGIEYKGVFTVQKDESKDTKEMVVFSVKGSDNSSIWGVKHSLTRTQTVMPNCTPYNRNGYHCSLCDETVYEYVAKTSHSSKVKRENVVEPTCTKNGSYDKVTYCSTCGKELSRKKVVTEYLGHDYVESYKAFNRCDKSDLEIRECKRCGLIQELPTTPVTKHSYTSKVTKAPTSKATGIMTYSCKNCSYKYTKSIPKLATTSITSLTPKSKSFVVKWSKKTASTGYQIRYSTSSKMSNPKTVTITKNTTVSKTVSNLKAKKKYYVQVRTYKTINGKKYYSPWSSKKSVTTKK